MTIIFHVDGSDIVNPQNSGMVESSTT